MRLGINLATRPYEDARQFWMQWGAGVGLLALVTLALVAWAVHGWINAGRDRQTIAYLQQQINQRDSERASAEVFLNRPENRSTRDQSQFLNSMIERKGFSWTRVFEDLEQVMPTNLHVVSLRPEINEQNQIWLNMRVAGDTRAGAIELLHRMEQSKHFRDAQITGEGVTGQNDSGVGAEIVAAYVPAPEERSGK
jgi:Tfp pilus assembly protein PilN